MDMVINQNRIHSARILFENFPIEVMKLSIYRFEREGATRPDAYMIESQREIIRWLIKPSSADNSKELEMIKKQLGR